MILSNQVRCLKCGDEPWSAHRHDFRYCGCGAVAVDGGQDYLRRLGQADDMEDMSLSISDKHLELLKDAITDPERNELGKVCNVARVLRDDMGINLTEQEDDYDEPVSE
jgi:hypothetical protein